MPSRRPPSQRDPAYALHRLPGTVAQAAPGLKVKNATPVRPAAVSRKAAITPTAGPGASRTMYLYDPTLNYATQTSMFLLSQAQDNGFQDTSGVFAMTSTESLRVRAEDPLGASPDFTGLNIRVTKVADSGGVPLSSGSKVNDWTDPGFSSTSSISRTSGTVTETGMHTGTLFHTTSGTMDITFDVTGWFQVYVYLTWS